MSKQQVRAIYPDCHARFVETSASRISLVVPFLAVFHGSILWQFWSNYRITRHNYMFRLNHPSLVSIWMITVETSLMKFKTWLKHSTHLANTNQLFLTFFNSSLNSFKILRKIYNNWNSFVITRSVGFLSQRLASQYQKDNIFLCSSCPTMQRSSNHNPLRTIKCFM